MKNLLTSFAFILLPWMAFAQINASSFAAPIGFSTGSNTGSINLAIEDFNRDGKPDVAVVNQSFGKLSVFRNNGIAGVINSSTFGNRFDLLIGSASNTLNFVKAGFINNDTFPDLVIGTGTGNSIAICRNTTDSLGNISFANPILLSAQSNTVGVSLADFDGDGKLDLVAANYDSHSLSVFRNTTTGLIPSFASPLNVSSSLLNPNEVVSKDVNGDNKPDLVAFNFGNNTVSIFRNSSTGVGNIGFLAVSPTLSGNSGVFRGDVADMNGDGKPDIIASSYSSQTISIYTNQTSSPSTVSFGSKFDVPIGVVIQGSRIGDLDKDGVPECIGVGGATSQLKIVKNFASMGVALNANTLQTNIPTVLTASGPTGVEIADVDNDGMPEILTAGFSGLNTSFVVHKNLLTPSTSLVAKYNFSNNLLDSSGYNNPITSLPSGITYGQNRFQNANASFLLNGQQNAAFAASSAPTNLGSAIGFSLSTWCRFNTDTITNTKRTLVNFHDNFNRVYRLVIEPNTGEFGFEHLTGITTSVFYIPAKTKLLPGLWWQLGVTLDSANRLTLFMNGMEDTSLLVAPHVRPAMVNIRIGADGLNTNKFTGHVDDVLLYRRVISNQEMANLYNYYAYYFSKSTGSIDNPNTWGRNRDGSGLPPAAMSAPLSSFILFNNSSGTIDSSLQITGNNSLFYIPGTYNFIVSANKTAIIDSMVLLSGGVGTIYGNLQLNKHHFDSNTSIQFMASGSQTIPSANYYNLVLFGGSKTLQGNVRVRNELYLGNVVHTQNHILTVGTGNPSMGVISIAPGAYINGNLARVLGSGNQASSWLFPVGNTSGLRMMSVAIPNLSSGGTLTAKFVNLPSGNNGLPLLDFSQAPSVILNTTNKTGYWQLLASNGLALGGGNTHTLSLYTAGITGLDTLSKVRIVARTTPGTGNWQVNGMGATTSGGGLVSRAGFTVFGEFTFASDSASNSLPVSWLNFEGFNKDGNNFLSWSTSWEQNNDEFEVERSDDGIHFHQIGLVKGNGNVNRVSSYSFVDKADKQHTHYYYRLKQKDFNGSFQYSTILHIVLESDEPFLFYPNPTSHNIEIVGNVSDYVIYNSQGESVMEGKLDEGKKILNISELPTGVYLFKCGLEWGRFVKN